MFENSSYQLPTLPSPFFSPSRSKVKAPPDDHLGDYDGALPESIERPDFMSGAETQTASDSLIKRLEMKHRPWSDVRGIDADITGSD